MKNNIVFMSVILCFLAIQVFAGARAMVTVRVLDETNAPVVGARVGVGFEQAGRMGGWGIPVHHDCVTDTNGMAQVSDSCEGAVGVSVGKDGYYGTYGTSVFFKSISCGKWQPWNPTVESVIKKVINPTAMYAKNVGSRGEDKLPIKDKAVGYDLMRGDWVAPYGKGESSDFIFRLSVKDMGIDPESRFSLYDSTVTLVFFNDGDGIQSVYVQPFVGCVLNLPRVAPETGYISNWGRRMQYIAKVGLVLDVPEGYGDKNDLVKNKAREDQNYIFRVRTKKDDQGRIISVLYGVISGNIECDQNGRISFSYYLNPSPNDRNLEYDGKKNLFRQ